MYNRKQHHTFKPQIIIGRKPLLEKLSSSPESVERIYILHGAHGPEIADIIHIAKQNQVPILRVPIYKLQNLTRSNHQGVIAFSALIPFMPIDKVVDHIFSQGEIPLLLMVDSVNDVGNLGAMARTAWVSGFHAIILPLIGTPPIQEGAIKASAGALNHINVCRTVNLTSMMSNLKLSGIQIIASSMKAKKSLKQIDFTIPTAVIMGNEQSGVAPKLIAACDEDFAIPMRRDMDSYNVSVAFGMVAYESMLQMQTHL